MTRDELMRALDGLFAYDTGCVSSGIHDEVLRARADEALSRMGRVELAHLLRDMWLSDDAIELGYGAEDLMQFLQWLDDSMSGYER